MPSDSHLVGQLDFEHFYARRPLLLTGFLRYVLGDRRDEISAMNPSTTILVGCLRNHLLSSLLAEGPLVLAVVFPLALEHLSISICLTFCCLDISYAMAVFF